MTIEPTKETLNYFESLVEENIPEFFTKLTPDQTIGLKNYIESIVKEQNQGLDKFFDGMVVSMKYIPNFILTGVIKQFMEPALAARVAVKMDLRALLNLSKDLSADYLGETSIHLPLELAIEIFLKLKYSLQKDTIKYVAKMYPLKSLDLYESLPNDLKVILVEAIDLSKVDVKKIISPTRKKALLEIQKTLEP